MLARYIREVNVHVYSVEMDNNDVERGNTSTSNTTQPSVDENYNEQPAHLGNNIPPQIEGGEGNCPYSSIYSNISSCGQSSRLYEIRGWAAFAFMILTVVFFTSFVLATTILYLHTDLRDYYIRFTFIVFFAVAITSALASCYFLRVSFKQNQSN